MKTKLAMFLFGTALAGLAPTSSLVMSVEGGGPGGESGGGAGTGAPAGAPAATNTTTSNAPAPGAPAAGAAPGPAPGAAPGAERTFTQRELDAILQDRLARDRQSRGGNEAPANRPAEQRSTATPPTEAQRLDRIEAENALYRAASRSGVALSEAQEIDLLDLYRVQRPEQPGAWFDAKVAAFNLKPPAAATNTTVTNTAATNATQQQTQATQQQTAPAAGAASTTVPGAVNPLATGSLIDVSRLGREDIKRMGAKGVATAVAAVLEHGRGTDGRPPLPAALQRKP